METWWDGGTWSVQPGGNLGIPDCFLQLGRLRRWIQVLPRDAQWQACSGTSHTLQQDKHQLGTGTKMSQSEGCSMGTHWPRKVGSLHPWRYTKFDWTRPYRFEGVLAGSGVMDETSSRPISGCYICYFLTKVPWKGTSCCVPLFPYLQIVNSIFIPWNLGLSFLLSFLVPGIYLEGYKSKVNKMPVFKKAKTEKIAGQ